MKANIRCLSGNVLKILAAIFMVCDHIGLFFYPDEIAFRLIGRLSFPIFAFMIAEGARYARNKLRYLAAVGGLGVICQLVYFFFAGSTYMCILITFTLSIIMIYALAYFKECLFSKKAGLIKKLLSGALFVLTVCAVYLLNRYVAIDYGFLGCLAPVFASLFDFRAVKLPKRFAWLDSLYLRIGAFSVGLIIRAIVYGETRWVSLFAIPLLLLYSGKRGKAKMKYFFYVFYPAHLVLLQAIVYLLAMYR